MTGTATLLQVLVMCERHESRWVERTVSQLGLTIAGNGAYQVRPWCDDCARWATGSVPLTTLAAKGFLATDLQLVADHRGSIGRCAHAGCDREAVEDHHFAPRAIFGSEADEWPRALLCVEHHAEWHRRMRVAA